MKPDYVNALHAATQGNTVRILWGADKTPFVPEAQLTAANKEIANLRARLSAIEVQLLDAQTLRSDPAGLKPRKETQ